MANLGKGKIKAIVMSLDRNRAMTEHMILQYEKLWPDHPFIFRIPYQTLGGKDSETRQYIQSPEPVRATVLRLLEDVDDEEWIWWCLDDKYPVRLMLDRVKRFIELALESPKMSGMLFCRCRQLLRRPKKTLFPGKWRDRDGQVYYERRGWQQIFIHQLLRAKVPRHLYLNLPAHGQRDHDKLKHDVIKPPDWRLFVTRENFAVFGESTQLGKITQNCYDSIIKTDIELPERFHTPNGRCTFMGELPDQSKV